MPVGMVTVIWCPPNATVKIVSEAALMIRSRTLWPGLALNVSGAAGTLPFGTEYGYLTSPASPQG